MEARGTVNGHSHRSSKHRSHATGRNSHVESVIVNPDVLALAFILADGNIARITDRTYNSVLVTNHGR